MLTTTVVGSYPQPDWLVDRTLLGKGVPRVRMQAMWRIPEPWLEQAQDDATVVAIREMERAGVEVVTDGEIRRESYSNRFATALDGVDIANPGVIRDRNGNDVGNFPGGTNLAFGGADMKTMLVVFGGTGVRVVTMNVPGLP